MSTLDYEYLKKASYKYNSAHDGINFQFSKNFYFALIFFELGFVNDERVSSIFPCLLIKIL